MAGLCATPEAFGFSFTEGEVFRIDMNDLAIFEMFLDEFTSMLNNAFHDTYSGACGLNLKAILRDGAPASTDQTTSDHTSAGV